MASCRYSCLALEKLRCLELQPLRGEVTSFVVLAQIEDVLSDVFLHELILLDFVVYSILLRVSLL